MVNLVLDTNVFYDLADGRIDISNFADSSDQLFYSPLSVLEIAGKWSPKLFRERKAAARAILDCGAAELPDQDSFLAQIIFRYALRRPIVSLKDAVVAMAKSRSLEALEGGVEDQLERVVRKVNSDWVRTWRGVVEGMWVRDLESIQDREVPRFAAWRIERAASVIKPVPKLRGARKQDFIQKTHDPNWNLTLISICHKRALLTARKTQPDVSYMEAYQTITKAVVSLSCYCSVYTQYLIRLLTEGALPDPNDDEDRYRNRVVAPPYCSKALGQYRLKFGELGVIAKPRLHSNELGVGVCELLSEIRCGSVVIAQTQEVDQLGYR